MSIYRHKINVFYHHIVCYIDKMDGDAYRQEMNHDWIYPLIGAVIKRRRKQFSWTQEKLAARLGISRASLASIEIGRQNVLVHQLYSFAEALDLSPQDMLPPPAARQGSDDAGGLPLPPGLKQQQKDQIARLLGSSLAEPSRNKEGSHGKQTKR